MLHLDLSGKYADVMEQALFNGALTGLARDGQHYFYENPLESDGKHTRWKWHTCPCCTMNVSRLIASVGGYVYSTSKDTVAVHLYGGSSTTVTVGERKLRVKETSNYPWSGAIRVAIDPETPGEFVVKLRVPGWAHDATAKINGAGIDVAGSLQNSYLDRRTWSAGDAIDLELPMPVERVYAHPSVKMDIGRTVLKRGPLVYCAEQVDNPRVPVEAIRMPRDGKVATRLRSDLFGGIVTVVAQGQTASTADWNGDLYRASPPRKKRRRGRRCHTIYGTIASRAECWYGYRRTSPKAGQYDKKPAGETAKGTRG
jgi:DUF1680 family protein